MELMNRVESKFILPVHQLPLLVSGLCNSYYLQVAESGPFAAYRTVYYDSPEFGFYMAHHNGRAQRIKVRERTYLNTSSRYLELKFRGRANRVVKERVKRTQATAGWTTEELALLQKKIPGQQLHALSPVLEINYNRLTFLSKTNSERVTLDLALDFSNGNKHHKPGKLIIAEIKQLHKGITPAYMVLEKMGIKPVSLSKYCLGINYLYPAIRKNNFKQRLHSIQKLDNNDISFPYTAA